MSEPTRWVGCFLVDSWLEHLRQHECATVSDRAAWEKVRAFQIGDDPPRVTHLVAALDEPDDS
jgi:hypothetical protein